MSANSRCGFPGALLLRCSERHLRQCVYRAAAARGSSLGAKSKSNSVVGKGFGEQILQELSFGRRQFWSLQLSGLAQVASSRLKLQLAGGFMLRGGRATTLALLSSDAGRARAVARTGSFWGHDMPQPAPNRPVHLVSGLEPSLRLAGPRKSSGQKHSHEQVHWIW